MILWVTHIAMLAGGLAAGAGVGALTLGGTTVIPEPTDNVLDAAVVTPSLPDHGRSPGDTLPVDAATVCVPGYASSVRDVPTATKKAVFRAYGLRYPQPAGAYEVDHEIPLSLGGSNSPRNLWPQPAQGGHGFPAKDALEHRVYVALCAGQTTLAAAQKCMIDWVACYRETFNHEP